MQDFKTQALSFTGINDKFILRDGNAIPCVGFGTWKIKDQENGATFISKAIELGYRHFDTAALYGSEGSIGEAVQKSGLPRADFFITSKIWKDDNTQDAARRSLEKTLRQLKSEYVDLLLIHWPRASRNDAGWQEKLAQFWQLLIKFKQEGKAKSIGVANFLPHHFAVLGSPSELPVINQIEFHPGYLQLETYQYCHEHQILVEGWRPLGQGTLIEDPKIQTVAAKYQVSPAQILLRFALQYGVLPLPKSTHADRMRINTEIFNFNLSKEDLQELSAMPLAGWSGEHPDHHIPFDE